MTQYKETSATDSQPEPFTIRLPKTGERCPYTGETRSGLNSLILPCPANDYKPQVKSFVDRRPGNIRGIRLIVWASLKRYLLEQKARGDASEG